MTKGAEGVIDFAARAGVEIGEFEARSWLLAKRILSDPKSDEYQKELARVVVQKFGDAFPEAFMIGHDPDE